MAFPSMIDFKPQKEYITQTRNGTAKPVAFP